jgi:hypothetical protein
VEDSVAPQPEVAATGEDAVEASAGEAPSEAPAEAATEEAEA